MEMGKGDKEINTYSFAFFFGPGLLRTRAPGCGVSPLALPGPALAVPSTSATAAVRFRLPFFLLAAAAPSSSAAAAVTATAAAAPLGGAMVEEEGVSAAAAWPLGVVGVDSDALSSLATAAATVAPAVFVVIAASVSSSSLAGRGVDGAGVRASASASASTLLLLGVVVLSWLSGKIARSLSGDTVRVTIPGAFLSSFSDFRRSFDDIM